MPRAARFRIAALADLFRQLRFAPAETRTREMHAAEQLLGDVEPELTYPHDFVTYRITGYRPDAKDESTMLVGAALVGDLTIFIQHLSAGLGLAADHDGRVALTIDEVAARLRVSTKTVQRYRRRGLVCHFIVFPDGVKRLACFEDALARFAGDHRDQLDRAAGFTRVADDAARSIIDEAAALRVAEGLSLNEAALRLARTHGRAHETVRSILRRHDRRGRDGETPIFGEHGPITERDARLIHRAIRRGVPAGVLATRFRKTPATIQRAHHRHRAALLRALDLPWVALPTFDLDDAETVILAAPSASTNLDDLPPTDDALAFIEAAHGPAGPEGVEDALVAAFNLLKRRAATSIAALPAWPPAGAIDRVETDLRWATRVKTRLVALGMPGAVGRIDQFLHRPLATLPGHRIVELLTLTRDVISQVVDTLDPNRGQRLAAVGPYAVDRALAASGTRGGGSERARGQAGAAAAEPPRAAARHQPGAIRLDGFFAGLTTWEPLVDLRSDLAGRVDRLDAPRAAVVRAFYGLAGVPPQTRAEVAAALDLSRAAVDRFLRTAHRDLAATAGDGA